MLSHCSGPDQTFLQLTADNLDNFHIKIPFASLPRTSQDAVVTMKRLQLKYLWIDSLCILQTGEGSLEDWRKRTGVMRSVFSNCMLNIAASRARCAEGGCFAVRDLLFVQPCIVRWHEFRNEDMRHFRSSTRNYASTACSRRCSQNGLGCCKNDFWRRVP